METVPVRINKVELEVPCAKGFLFIGCGVVITGVREGFPVGFLGQSTPTDLQGVREEIAITVRV